MTAAMLIALEVINRVFFRNETCYPRLMTFFRLYPFSGIAMLGKLFRFVAVAGFCLAILPAGAQDYASRLALGDHFIAALKQQRFDEAAAMFASASHDKAEAAKISGILKRVGEHVGGFANMKSFCRRDPDSRRRCLRAGCAPFRADPGTTLT